MLFHMYRIKFAKRLLSCLVGLNDLSKQQLNTIGMFQNQGIPYFTYRKGYVEHNFTLNVTFMFHIFVCLKYTAS